MTPQEVLNTYDDNYAHQYEAKFILNAESGFHEKAQFELGILRALTAAAESWLDVACGTGFFLKYGRGHSNLICGGLDLSAAMLELAAVANPDTLLIEADFRKPQPAFKDRWGITSCLWGAYALQETIEDIRVLIANLAQWTRPGGVCFLPVFDPSVLAVQRRLGLLPEGMDVERNGTRWTYKERDGKTHRNVITPPVAIMTDIMNEFFVALRTFPYPGMRRGVPMIGILGARENV